MPSTVVTLDALMKEKYIESGKVEELVYADNPVFAMMEQKADDRLYGDAMPVPILYGAPQGLSGNFVKAQANATNVKAEKFIYAPGDYYGVVSLGDKVMRLSATNAGAFFDDKTLEIDQLYMQAGECLSLSMWGNGGGSIGRIATISGNVVTLVEPSDAANFEVAMTVSASVNDGATATDQLRDGGDGTTVAGVDRGAGIVTLTDASAIAGMVAGDYLFRQGDFYGNQGSVIMKGIQSFIPSSNAGIVDLWGVTQAKRLSDVQRFSGCRLPDSEYLGLTDEDRITKLFAWMGGRFKAQLSDMIGVVHPESFQVLANVLAAKGIRPTQDSNTKFGFAKIDVATPTGPVPIYSDRHCPKGHFFALRKKNWWIASVGDLIAPQELDGLTILRSATSTDYEYRLISYPALVCNGMRSNGRVPLSTFAA